MKRRGAGDGVELARVAGGGGRILAAGTAGCVPRPVALPLFALHQAGIAPRTRIIAALGVAWHERREHQTGRVAAPPLILVRSRRRKAAR